MKNFKLIIDFDSTFVTVEGLEELSKICLKNNPKKEKIISKIENLTNLGMEGKISFSKSLKKRLELIRPSKKDLKKLISILKKSITPSIQNNINFFQKYSNNIYIISGGFQEWILPIVLKYSILKKNVFANKFKFDKNGKIIGYDQENPLSQDKGKVRIIKKLKLKGNIYILGDGFSDYEIKKYGYAKKFFAFSENVRRSDIISKTDLEIKSFDEIIKYLSEK